MMGKEIYKLKIEIAALYGVIDSMLESIPSLKKREEYLETLIAATKKGFLRGFDFSDDNFEDTVYPNMAVKVNVRNIYKIDVQYFHADLTAQVTLMGGKTTRFVFSPELRELFEKEMNKQLYEFLQKI